MILSRQTSNKVEFSAMKYQVFKDGRWQNPDGSPLTIEQLQSIADGLALELSGQSDFRYSHDEIEAACGGAEAMEIRRRVLERRLRIRQPQPAAPEEAK